MSSGAYSTLQLGLEEVSDLIKADPTPRGGISPEPSVSRAVLRSAVVLLCGHFERYIRSVNEEAIELINNSKIEDGSLPVTLRLEHSKVAIDEMSQMQWTNRANALSEFVTSEAWLWGEAPQGQLAHSKILSWLKTPSAKRIGRFYRTWGIDDIFDLITRKEHIKRWFSLKITELAEKRNNIAHGDFSTEATREELVDYKKVIAIFSKRVDRRMHRILSKELGISCPWY